MRGRRNVLVLVDPRPLQPLQPDRLLAMHAALAPVWVSSGDDRVDGRDARKLRHRTPGTRQAEDQAGRRVRVDNTTNFRAAPRPRLVLPMEKAHGAACEVAVAAAVVRL